MFFFLFQLTNPQSGNTFDGKQKKGMAKEPKMKVKYNTSNHTLQDNNGGFNERKNVGAVGSTSIEDDP